MDSRMGAWTTIVPVLSMGWFVVWERYTLDVHKIFISHQKIVSGLNEYMNIKYSYNIKHTTHPQKMSNIAWVILAAGEGKRIMSAFPDQEGVRKPFLRIAGKPMIHHLVDTIGHADPIILVVSPTMDYTSYPLESNVRMVHQTIALGTGDAFRVALTAIDNDRVDTIIVLNGDGPAVPIDYIRELSRMETSCVILVRRNHLPFAHAMGKYHLETRTIEEHPVVRHPDDLVNTGVYILRNDASLSGVVTNLPLHEPGRPGGRSEYFLTDLLELVHVRPWVLDDKDVAVRLQGINTMEE